VAAVSDWRPETTAKRKIKKDAGGPPAIKLEETPDILASLAKGKRRPRLVVGFAAETGDLEAKAKAKLKSKGCDWIVANDVTGGEVFGGDANSVALVTKSGVERWDLLPKAEVATRLAQKIAEEFK
jgi:phosphopantothenoylcysteine decarboxylase/phosphopantothenate--cysteine ligase